MTLKGLKEKHQCYFMSKFINSSTSVAQARLVEPVAQCSSTAVWLGVDVFWEKRNESPPGQLGEKFEILSFFSVCEAKQAQASTGKGTAAQLCIGIYRVIESSEN